MTLKKKSKKSPASARCENCRKAETPRSAEKLRVAVDALYFAAYWTADRSVDEAALWTAVRDAAGIAPGQTAARLGAKRDALAAKLAEATAFAVTEQRERLAVEEKLRVATEALRCDSCGSTVWECDRCANRTEFAATTALAGEKEG